MTEDENKPGCPWCRHAIEEHEERGGHRVCTRGRERPSCRACAEIRDSLTVPAVPLDFDLVMSRLPSVLPMPLIFGRPFRGRYGTPPVTVPDVR
ncbi:hypothetical protein RKD44_005348 [Streptomyces collinus]